MADIEQVNTKALTRFSTCARYETDCDCRWWIEDWIWTKFNRFWKQGERAYQFYLVIENVLTKAFFDNRKKTVLIVFWKYPFHLLRSCLPKISTVAYAGGTRGPNLPPPKKNSFQGKYRSENNWVVILIKSLLEAPFPLQKILRTLLNIHKKSIAIILD